jgi:hypothetical protein
MVLVKIYGIQNYKDVGWGESLFIIGNGSSIRKSDLKKLRPEKTMTVNRSWKLVPSEYHAMIMHSGYIKDIANMDIQPQCLFVAGAPAEVEAKYRKMLQNEVCFVPRRTPNWRGVTPYEYLNLDSGWYPTHTGLFAIQVAYYMNFKHVFLLGFDGYGCHFEADEINPLDDHERHTKELEFLKDAMDKLTRDKEVSAGEIEASETVVYNCNPANAYNVFTKISLDDALDLSNGDI